MVNGATVKRQANLRDVTTSNNCPGGWDASPCSCKDGPTPDKASVFCDNATSGDQIKEVFSKLSANHHFANFFMADSPVTLLPAEVFGKASFQFFFISNTNLATLDDATFKGSEETAENFLLQNNSFESFNFKALNALKNLHNFELSRDKLKAVPDEAFGEHPLLEVIDLNGNQISTLGQNAFAKLPKLRKIDLSNNKLTELKEGSFKLSPDVSPIAILVSHNEISKIDKKAFENAKVRLVEIEDNKLESLDKDIFEPLINSLSESRGSMSTLGNPFSCDQTSTKWVVDLPAEKRSLIIGYMCRDGRALQQLNFS